MAWTIPGGASPPDLANGPSREPAERGRGQACGPACGLAGARSSDRTRAAILRAARAHFARHGYERTTIRAVAADAAIDASMVMRYFGSKEKLFDAALTIDLRLPDLTAVARDDLPHVLVRHFLDRWEGDPADDALLLLLRSAVTNERAAARLREIFAEQVAPALGRGHRPAPRRAGLRPAARPRPHPLSAARPGRHRPDAGRGRRAVRPGPRRRPLHAAAASTGTATAPWNPHGSSPARRAATTACSRVRAPSLRMPDRR